MDKEFQKIPVYCSHCKERVLYWNGITKMQIGTKCNNCGRMVIFDPTANPQVRTKEMPIRQDSSGVRFW